MGATNTIVAMNNNNNSNPVSTMEENNNKLETGDGAHPGTYTCEFCCKSFKRPNSLRKHILQAHPMGDDVSACSPVDSVKETTSSSNSPMSSPTSITKYSIAELLSPNKSEKKSDIPCLSCSDSFSNVAELSHHIST